MTHTLRTTAKRWSIKLCTSTAGSLLFCSLYGYGYFESSNAKGRLFCVIGLILFSVLMVLGVLPLLRNKIVFDDQTISGHVCDNRFSLRWRDVIAVWDSTWLRHSILNISASDQRIRIPLKFFDEKLLRDLVRLHVAPEAFEKDAIKRMMGFRVRDAVNDRIIEEANESLRVGAKSTKWVAWVCGLLFLLATAGGWLVGAGIVSSFFLIFVALCAYLILTSGSTEMNKDSITYTTPTGVYRIGWDEITEVEINPLGGDLVFTGHNKVLSMLSPYCWSGKDKERMLRLFSAQIGNRDIAVKEMLKVIRPRNKNTKTK